MKLKYMLVFLLVVFVVGCTQTATPQNNEPTSVQTTMSDVVEDKGITVEINLLPESIEPAEIKIPAGSIVKWNILDNETHRLVGTEFEEIDDLLEQSFDEAGVYDYVDEATGQKGKIIVE